MRWRLSLAGGALVAAAAALPAHAAGTHARAELLVLKGTQVDGGGSIDPKIGDLPQLKTRPLSSYNTYSQLDRTTLDLEQGQPTSYPAQNGTTLTVKLKQVSDDRYTIREEFSGGNLRHSVHVEFTSGASDSVFVGGLPYQGGAIFFGIKILP